MFGSTKASILTVPTASKKFGRSGLARESGRDPLFEDALGRNEEPFVDPKCSPDDVEDATALEEKFRNVLSD